MYAVIGETGNSFEYRNDHGRDRYGWKNKGGTFIRFEDETAARRVCDTLAEVRNTHDAETVALADSHADHWRSVVRMFTPTKEPS